MCTKTVMGPELIKEAVTRIACEIVARNSQVEDLRIIGVRTRGVHIAERIAVGIKHTAKEKPLIGVVDITLYRDDLRRKSQWPEVKRTNIPFNVDNKTVVLVDDVLYTGRTARAAMEAIMDYGRPDSIQLAVLIDRGLRELPIHADYVGATVDTSAAQTVKVLLEELDGRDEVIVHGE
ncbi:MAG: bifunctional pyr operon transcriptional regulator/uracil phosphoribosyltransferase PyrR [Candidatus Dadabacteria bacterium]|nr:bifunctional pyr operon transcriptional regulator/uracil phosphoribosyltransferase PyrR [Candidatus Dadabacteria bacterium]